MTKNLTEAATDNRFSRPEISSFINWRIIPMHSAAKFQFERVVHEFAQWRAVPEAQRSPAPSWWWQPALEAREQPEEMPPIRRHHLELPIGSTLRDRRCGANSYARRSNVVTLAGRIPA
jgi:hypothetical protein